MNLEHMTAILEKIQAYETVILFRHLRPDGDAVGATKGLCEILRLSYPEKKIYVNNADYSDFVAFLGEEDEPLSDEIYANALGIVIDTATTARISNPRYALCREIVKIDHHIETEPYGTCRWVEEHKSSACEMIVEFYYTFRDRLKINREAATYLYAGMVTDSGRFRFRDVSGNTLRLAGMLLDIGIDTENLYANLYLKEFHTFRFESFVHEKMKITENGVAWMYISKATQKKFGLSGEDASASVSYMDSIKGAPIWLAFIENKDGSIRVRLRSRFITVSELANKYRGGGHACAAGATVYSKKEVKQLVAEADAMLREYKKTHGELI